MSKVMVENRSDISILRLDNGVTNAIGPDLLGDLSTALKEVATNSGGIVLSGGSKFFSAGLDLPGLLELNRRDMTEFWHNFFQIVFDLYTVPLPTACAISGHAVAGGNVLALTCDYRIAANENKKIGLNEIKLGIPVPYLVDMILRQVVGDRVATEMLYRGNFMSLPEAGTVGLVDELCSPDAVEERAVEKVAELAAFNRPAFSASKENRVEEIRERYEKRAEAKNAFFIDCWFSQPVQEKLREASRKF